MASFNPETDIPAEYWSFVEKSRDETSTRAYLSSCSKEELVRLFRHGVEARAELAYVLVEEGRVPDASEDTLDDLSEGIISQGRRAYLDCYYGRRALPPRQDWEDMRALIHILVEAHRQRFEGENIFDSIED
ncbi:MAG: hypothetical protein QM765_02535 [Myxococcales bacterium]